MTYMLDAVKPCPFCGHVGLDFREGTTFRWLSAECGAPSLLINFNFNDLERDDVRARLKGLAL